MPARHARLAGVSPAGALPLLRRQHFCQVDRSILEATKCAPNICFGCKPQRTNSHLMSVAYAACNRGINTTMHEDNAISLSAVRAVQLLPQAAAGFCCFCLLLQSQLLLLLLLQICSAALMCPLNARVESGEAHISEPPNQFN
jgi:hypothetical protein